MNAQDSRVRLKAFLARLDPKPAALDRIRQTAGCRRYVYNRLLAERQAAWKALGESPDSQIRKAFGREWSYVGMAKRITLWRSQLSWLRDCPVHALQNGALDLQTAYENWWAGRAGAPCPKKKSRGLDSWTESDPACFSVNGQAVRLPKIGWVRARISQPLEGVVRRITIKQDGESWVASLLVEETLLEAPRPNGQPPVGLDLGIVHAVTDSEGKVSDLAPRTSAEKRHLRRLARAVSRKKKGSRNREKAKRRLGRARRRMDRRIGHEIHVFTCRTAKNHGLVAVEDLEVQAMSASAAGSRELPGTRVAAKRGLNREIRERRWGEIRRQLEYKCLWYGSRLVAVPAAGSSQECSACGHQAVENRKTQAQFGCLACGHQENADQNAAKVILKRALKWAAGHAASACGESVRPRKGRRFSKKQEPPLLRLRA
jgi:putative transposase